MYVYIYTHYIYTYIYIFDTNVYSIILRDTLSHLGQIHSFTNFFQYLLIILFYYSSY